MPIYLVKQTLTQGDESYRAERLIDAKNKASAMQHVAKDTIAVKSCEPADLIRLTKDGVNVENAE